MKDISLYVYGRAVVEENWQINKNRAVNRLYYVNAGRATVYHGSAEYTLIPGRVYILPQCKEFHPILAERFDHTFFDFYSLRTLNPQRIIEPNVDRLGAKAFFSYINSLIESDPKRRLAGAMKELLCGFLSLMEADGQPLPFITNEAITRAIERIHSDYAQICTKRLANELNLNESYFIRLFGKTMGISPMKYIRAVRVSNGRALLRQGVGVAEAAERCGYSSPASFYKATREELGLSPSALRYE